jgi:hypothetical protein
VEYIGPSRKKKVGAVLRPIQLLIHHPLYRTYITYASDKALLNVPTKINPWKRLHKHLE